MIVICEWVGVFSVFVVCVNFFICQWVVGICDIVFVAQIVIICEWVGVIMICVLVSVFVAQIVMISWSWCWFCV